MEKSEHGLVAASGMEKKFRAALPEYFLDRDFSLVFSEFAKPIDSSHASLDLAVQIYDVILSVESSCDAFLVLMGSDTLSFVASTLAYLMHEQNVPVIVSGSMAPLGSKQSDANSNIQLALDKLKTFSSAKTPVNVWVTFGNRLIPAVRCKKMYAEVDEAMIQTGASIKPRINSTTSLNKSSLPAWQTKPRSIDIRVIRVLPSICEETIKAQLSGSPDACIVECYAGGTLPSETSPFCSALLAAAKRGVPLFMVSQCVDVYVCFETYASSAWLQNADLCSCGDMNIEAAYSKLWYLLNLGLKGESLKHWMGINLCGERSD